MALVPPEGPAMPVTATACCALLCFSAPRAMVTATVSLTTDYLRPAPSGAWLEARTAVERMGGRLAFADCSVTADGREAVRARAVFAVRAGDEN